MCRLRRRRSARAKAAALIETRTQAGRLMRGYRGSAALDREATIDALVALGRIAEDLGDVAHSIDINPFVVLCRAATMRSMRCSCRATLTSTNNKGGATMADTWRALKAWPELILEQLEGAGVARVVLNRPDKRNCLNEPLVAAWFEALDMVRADRETKVVITKGAGPCFSSGLDLHFLRKVSEEMRDWDRPTPTVQMAEALRGFPRVVIAQVHGYCLGGALGIMNCHDLVFAAEDAQLGMPEILRGSFGQLVTSTLIHGGIPIKKVALMLQLVRAQYLGCRGRPLGRHLTGSSGFGT